MKFDVSAKIKPYVETSSEIPKSYEKYRLAGAEVEFTRGPFGFFLWQHLDSAQYIISLQQFWIDRRIRLYPNVASPTVAINCMITGDLVCVLQGKGKVPLIAGKYALYYVPPGMFNLAYFSKGYYETIDFELSEEYLRYFVQDHPKLKEIHERLRRGDGEGMQLDLRDINMAIREQITKIRDSTNDDTSRKYFLQNRINDILLEYLKELKATKNLDSMYHGKYDKLLEEIGEYIKVNLDKTHTMKKLSGQHYIHPATLEREFKKYYGKTHVDYISDLRLEGAGKLLAETDLQIAEIAARMGFTDGPHLSKSFKARYGLTPKEYRGKWKGFSGKDLG